MTNISFISNCFLYIWQRFTVTSRIYSYSLNKKPYLQKLMTKSDMTMQKKENLSPFKIKSLTLCLSSMIPISIFCRFSVFLKSSLCKNKKTGREMFAVNWLTLFLFLKQALWEFKISCWSAKNCFFWQKVLRNFERINSLIFFRPLSQAFFLAITSLVSYQSRNYQSRRPRIEVDPGSFWRQAKSAVASQLELHHHAGRLVAVTPPGA